METARITVTGIVQGVGFRPFIYLQAKKHKLNGTVNNNSQGVEILIQGSKRNIDLLVAAIHAEHPPLAKIDSVSVEQMSAHHHYPDFRIIQSTEEKLKTTRISPDAAVCNACLQELFDQKNRRYRYPYINCTHCGPRYTIIQDIPYDRKNTSMHKYIMCSKCREEYINPEDRRFHAQPIACFDCGPVYVLAGNDGNTLVQGKTPELTEKMIAQTAALLKDGKIVAMKGLGGYHLAVNAFNQAAVAKLRSRKYREKKPFAVMVKDIHRIEEFCSVSDAERKRLERPDHSILLLKKTDRSRLAPGVAPGNNDAGVMLAYTPLQHLVLAEVDFPLVMTSANISDEPISFTNKDAFNRLSGIADYFLAGERDIYIRTDDSVLRIWNGHDFPIRRARGIVPNPVSIHRGINQPVIGLGAELKNTVCLGFDSSLFVSHHIGDLKNKETFESFIQAVEHLPKIYEKIPVIIGHDLNEQYLSTQAAFNPPPGLSWLKNGRRIAVQHHHAHIASCMAEHGLDEPVIGIAFDGTGLGPDNTIWGGEILVADYTSFSREAFLKPVLLPPGDSTVKNPWKTALAYILQSGNTANNIGLPPAIGHIPEEEREIIRYQCGQKNAVPCSSAGRLFDAVSAIAGICLHADYEGQAAIECEQRMHPNIMQQYDFEIAPAHNSESLIIDWRKAVVQAVGDAVNLHDAGEIAAKYHNGLISVTAEAVERISRKTGIRKIVFSGGCFMNMYLSSRLLEYFENKNYHVYVHRQLPCNDGGISAGQVMIAYHTVIKEKK